MRHVITWITGVETIKRHTRAAYGCLAAGQSLWALCDTKAPLQQRRAARGAISVLYLPLRYVLRCFVVGKVHLKSHMVAHQERRFSCASCGYRALRKANLEAHEAAQHGTDRKPYRCAEPCRYSTGYAANLRKHQRLFCKFQLSADSSSSPISPAAGVAAPVNETETAAGGGIPRAPPDASLSPVRGSV